VAIDARNGLHAAWKMTFNASKDYDLFYAYRRAGREWGPFERILDGSETMISRPAVAADKDNFAYIVWEQDSETGTDIGFRSWKGSWSDPRIVVDSEGSALNPAILADEGLNLHLVWEDTRDDPGGNPEIYYKRLWPLGIWSSPQRLSEGHPSSEDSLPPRIEVSPRTRDLIVVWTEKGIVYQTIWPGRRREDVTRAASKARAEMAEVQRQPFVSSKAKEKYDQAVSYYDSGVQSLMAFDVDGAKTSFQNVVDVLDEGHLLEEEYKENLGRNMGLTLAVAGIIGGVVVVVPWLLIRNQEG
jgi:hypothetical protein